MRESEDICMSRRNMRTCLEPQIKFTLVVSLGGGGGTMVSVGAANVSAGAVKVSAGAGGGARVSAGGSAGLLSGLSAGISLGLSAGLSPAFPSGLSPGFPAFWPCEGGSGGRLGSFLAASSAALAAASAAFLRYSITGSPAMSERRFRASFSHSSGMSHLRMPRMRSKSPPRYRVSRLPFSSLMDMMAGSRVMRICDRLSQYWNFPASANTLRVVSMSSTCPSRSASLMAL